jgi:mono/diheme cytochrome c family protein
MRNRISLLAAALCLSAAVGTSVWAQSGSTVADGVYTDAQATRGESEYATNCAPCHGQTLQGNGEAPALTGADFTADWIGLTLGDLYDRIRTTMPQDTPGKLSRDQYADILSFVLKANGYPAGQKDLDKRSEYLKAIGFVAPPPAGAKHAGLERPIQLAQKASEQKNVVRYAKQ